MSVLSGVPPAKPVIPPLPQGATYAQGTDGKMYIKYATQNQNGQWVQTVQTLANGVLVPLLTALFPNGVTPNNYGTTILPNGATIGNFQPVQPQTGGGSGSNNTLLYVGLAALAGGYLITKTN